MCQVSFVIRCKGKGIVGLFIFGRMYNMFTLQLSAFLRTLVLPWNASVGMSSAAIYSAAWALPINRMVNEN